MIRHLFRLAWRRKGRHALVLVEIFWSFVVTAAVTITALYLWSNYRLPLGFDWNGVLALEIDRGSHASTDAQDQLQVNAMIRELQSFPDVAAVAAAFSIPYSDSTAINAWDAGEKHRVEAELVQYSDAMPSVLGIRLARGRWFEPDDAVRAWHPLVINARLARELYGADDPLGKRIPGYEDDVRVVGVLDEFRNQGELAVPASLMVQRLDLEPRPKVERKPGDAGFELSQFPRYVLLRLRPGTPAAFERELAQRAQRIGRGWSIVVRSLGEMRAAHLRSRLTPLVAGALVGAFLMLMVALGLVGVLWQNVTRRRPEIGLRRAVGASGTAVRWQILVEILILAALSLLLGIVLLAQLKLIALFAFLPGTVLAGGLAVAALLVLALAAVAGAYPSWMAARIQPSAALHDE